MAETIRIDGLRELEHALKQLPKATGKSVLRRILKKRAKPIADDAKALVPRDEGDLQESIGVSTKLSKRQAKLHRKQGRDAVEVFVGAGALPQAHLVEFGSEHNQPKPYMRPAWDANKSSVLDDIGKDLGKEIQKAAIRLAKRKA